MVAVAKEKLVIAVILALTLGQLFKIPIGYQNLQSVFVTPVDIATFILIVFWLFNKPNLQATLTRPILFFAGTAFLSLLINSRNLLPGEFITSFLYLFRWLMFSMLYFVVREFNLATKNRLIGWLAIGGMITVITGIIQYIFYPDLRNLYYAGWDEHLYRIFSVFLDPNFAGTFFVLTIVLMMGMFYEKTNRVWRVAISIGVILTTTATFLTYSRSAFLTLFIATATFLWLVNKKRLIVVFCLFFAVGIFLLPKNLPSEGVNLSRTASIIARQQSIEHAITIFKDNPLLGVGFNAYRYGQKRHGFLQETDWQTIHSGAGTDNSFLFVLATTGIVGFTAFTTLWYSIIKNALILSNKILPKVVFVSALTIVIDSFFVNSLFYAPILVWMWILVALMENK